MARDTNLSHEDGPGSVQDIEGQAGVAVVRERPGVRTHVLLVIAMALVIAVVTWLSLLLIQRQLSKQVTDDFSKDLDRSVSTFKNLQAERLAALDRENALLAKLPTLKALMTTGDDLTIQDGARQFWQVSGTDLFVLVDPTGRIVAAYSSNDSNGAALRTGIGTLLGSPDKHYLIDGDLLYACSLRPLFFGSDQEGTLLGYVVSGVSVERTLRQISEPTGVDAAFLSAGQVVVTSLVPAMRNDLAQQSSTLTGLKRTPATVTLGDTRFLSTTEELSAAATAPLQLVVFKSLKPAELSISRIDRMVVIVGFLALLSGTFLMVVVSRLVTRPLEELSTSVRAFGLGDMKHSVPRHGTQEVRQLSTAFVRMRSEIQKANQTVLESERLATIGRMASSVSHDLRHYLAAIYANAEFLASDRFSVRERAEIFGDIRTAVNGTTDMLESLLIFSRTGASIRRQPELMATLVERATALIRTHPDGDGVTLETHYGEPTETAAVVDGKQIERAISNLLLNACQSARVVGPTAYVMVTLEVKQESIMVNVIDNGPGVPECIRQSLFEPFVSEGKQKGTGLGLTLAHCIALEHGGEVILLSSRPGETIFQMKVARDLPAERPMNAAELKRSEQVIPDENVQS
jgi:signal transduction histidine kinase